MTSHAGVATFVNGTDGADREWGMGLSDDATESALGAVVSCGNRLAG